jgi:hypothetical protein
MIFLPSRVKQMELHVLLATVILNNSFPVDVCQILINIKSNSYSFYRVLTKYPDNYMYQINPMLH